MYLAKAKRKSVYKCPVCEKRSSQDLMAQDEALKPRWYHPECLEQALEKKRLDDIEQSEKDSMYIKLAEVYDIQNYEDISRKIYMCFSNLRAGNPVFKGKSFDKRYRAGFSYPIIERTIVECEDRLKYSIENKDFKSTTSKLYYGVKIIVDRIPAVQKKYEREQRVKAFNEENKRKDREKELDVEMLEAFEDDAMKQFKNKKRKKNENDISAFLSEEE